MQMNPLIDPILPAVALACLLGACSEGDTLTNGSDEESPPDDASATIQIDSTTSYQTIVGGWEAVAQACHFECPETFSQFRDDVARVAVEELGLTRIRLEVRSGQENSRDYAQEFVQGEIPFNTWKNNFYEIQNDNDDPFDADMSGFQFTELDLTVERVVEPIRQRLAGRGEDLYVNLNYVDFGGSSFEHFADPDEYAEFVLVMFQHLDQKYGLVPDALEIILEPDNAEGWSPAQIGRALAAAAERLRQNGYTPHFTAPSTMSMDRASDYTRDLLDQPGAREALTDLSYHRYRGVSEEALREIVDRAEAEGLRVAMLEHLRSGHETLHKDLTLGRNSAWQRFGLAWPREQSSSGASYLVVNPQSFEVSLSNPARFLSQYFRSIRPGARRVAASSTDGDLDPVAFQNADGRYVLIVKADGNAEFTVGGIPAGAYDVGITTRDSLAWAADQVTVEAGQPIELSIPREGVLSLRQR